MGEGALSCKLTPAPVLDASKSGRAPGMEPPGCSAAVTALTAECWRCRTSLSCCHSPAACPPLHCAVTALLPHCSAALRLHCSAASLLQCSTAPLLYCLLQDGSDSEKHYGTDFDEGDGEGEEFASPQAPTSEPRCSAVLCSMLCGCAAVLCWQALP